MGTRDYWGNTLKNENAYDIGANEWSNKSSAIHAIEFSEISVYPNPIGENKTLKVKITEAVSQPYTLNIIDMSGKQVITQNFMSNVVTPVEAAELANAVYYLTISNQSGRIFYKKAIITL